MIKRGACERYKNTNGLVRRGEVTEPHVFTSTVGAVGMKGEVSSRNDRPHKQEKALSLRSCVDLIITK